MDEFGNLIPATISTTTPNSENKTQNLFNSRRKSAYNFKNEKNKNAKIKAASLFTISAERNPPTIKSTPKKPFLNMKAEKNSQLKFIPVDLKNKSEEDILMLLRESAKKNDILRKSKLAKMATIAALAENSEIRRKSQTRYKIKILKIKTILEQKIKIFKKIVFQRKMYPKKK